MSSPKKLKFKPATDMVKKRADRVLRGTHTWPDPRQLAHEQVKAFGKVGGHTPSWIVLDEPLQLSTPLPPGGGIVTGNFADDIADGTLVAKLRGAGVQVEVPTAEEEAAELELMASMTQEQLNERFGMSPEDVSQWQGE